MCFAWQQHIIIICIKLIMSLLRSVISSSAASVIQTFALKRKFINICAHFIELAYFGLPATHTFSLLPPLCASLTLIITHTCRLPDHTQFQLESFSYYKAFVVIFLHSLKFVIKLIRLIEINHRKYNLRHVSQV